MSLESLEGRRLLAGDDALVDPLPPELATGVVAGRKWEDTNADGRWNGAEVGLAGVTIYSDLNENGRLDRGEPNTRTSRDIPETDFDEGGLYSLELTPGRHVIREVVPDGFTQTFPPAWTPFDPDVNGDEFAHVVPPVVEVEAGHPLELDLPVAITIEPFCIRPYEIDVVASSPDVILENMTGVQLNGCGGDRSEFEVFVATPGEESFEIQFVDLMSGSVLGSIPVIMSPDVANGSHVVEVEHNSYEEGFDFGNAPLFEGGTVEGFKWIDANGNGRRDDNEPGLAGVTIYADRNDNGRYDRGEPSTITQRDIPETDFDEAGQYRLSVPAGKHAIREIVPNNYAQTFPGIDARVIGSETGQMNPGVAFDFDVTDVEAHDGGDEHDALLAADVEMTVVWPDSCGALIDSATHSTVVGNHLIVDMAGHQVGDACAEVISPQTVSLTFEGLEPGDYSVVGILHETLRDGSERPTLTTAGTISIGGPGAHYVEVADGSTVSDIHFGNRSTLRPGSIHGRKWHDENGNGQHDPDEPGLPGVTIYLDLNRNGQLDEDEPSTVTAEENPNTRFEEAGRYSFEVNESERSYAVREVVPDGFQQTFPPSFVILGIPEDLPFVPPGRAYNGQHEVFVPSGEAVDQIDFGNQKYEPASVHGWKWADENGNGEQDPNEPGLPGVTIYVDRNANGVLDDWEPSAVTQEDDPNTDVDETGRYSIEGLPPGPVTVGEVVPAGFVQTFPPEIAFDVPAPFDPDLGIEVFWWPVYGRVHYVTLESGGRVDGLDFGNQTIRPGVIEGTKWLDENGNQTRDEGEPGLGGVTVYVDLNFNSQRDDDEPFAITQEDVEGTPENEAGSYRIEGIQPGHYAVREVVPDGFVQTFPVIWPPELFFPIEPGFPWGGPLPFSHQVTVPSGGTVSNIDFGNQRIEPGSIRGVKWLDANGDGTRNEDEPGLPGVTIYLDLNFNGELEDDEPFVTTAEDDPATLADESGTYSFGDLASQTYAVREVIPSGMEQTYPQWDGPVILPEFVDPLSPDELLPFFEPRFGTHHVYVANGDDVGGINFGNRPIPDPGVVSGYKWLDRDGDGTRGDDEPGLPGVVIFADLNRNGWLDRGEPQTVTQDDGAYRLALRPGEYAIREVANGDFVQTFPGPSSSVLHVDVEPVNPQTAISFDLVSAEMDIAADGVLGAVLTFEVTWRHGCGALLPEMTGVESDGGSIIHVELFGKGAAPNELCTQATVTETTAVHIPDFHPGEVISVDAGLFEFSPPLEEEPELTHHLHGLISLGGQFGFHEIAVGSGEVVESINFGNRSLGDRPEEPVADINHDGIVDVEDIDALAAAIRTIETEGGSYREDHDFSGDGIVDHADYEHLVMNVMDVPFGDANLDGVFNSEDIVHVFIFGEYEDGVAGNSTWSSGDWNGDGDFTSDDIVTAFMHGQYDPGPASQSVSADAVDAILALDFDLDDDQRKRA